MNKRITKYIAIAAVLFFSMPSLAQRCIINGNTGDSKYDGLTIYLQKLGIGDSRFGTKLDSAKITNGEYHFEIETAESPFIAHLSLPPIDEHFVYALPGVEVAIENGTIDIDYISHPTYTSYSLRGGSINAEIEQLMLKPEREVRDSVERISNDVPNRNDMIRDLYESLNSGKKQFIERNIGNDAGAYYLLMRHERIFSKEEYARLKNAVKPEYVQRKEAREAEIKKDMEAREAARRALRIGADAHQFTSKTVDGKSISFSDIYKPGRMMLIDFWASWCVPCRMEIPALKELYKNYHDKGLDILSISLDTKADAWHKALEKEQMPWMQVSTLEGFNSEPALKYAVHAIPFIVLIGKDGKISLVNLRGEFLEKKLKEEIEK